jgi:diguanylate cyclase (GGDEF)-like protein
MATMTKKMTESDFRALAESRLFRAVDIEHVHHLLEDCVVRDLRNGEVLLTRGDAPSQDVFVVLYGRVSVFLSGTASPSHTIIRAGECVGEMSAIDREPISATVVAQEDTRLLAIPEPVVWSLVNYSHAVARNLLYLLSRRMRHDNEVIVNGLDRQRELEDAASTDGLTGLHNRRWMNEAFRRQLDRCDRDDVPASLVLIDLDGLKAFNDRAGHLAGDMLICMVADVLARHLRPGDLLARFGGDEFCLLLPDTARPDALMVADRLRAAIEAESPGRNLALSAPATISCGVSSSPPAANMQELLHAADQALYRAKEKGRNVVSE